MKTLLPFACAAAILISTAVAENPEIIRFSAMNGTAVTVLRPVEKTTSVAVYAGKRSFARRESAPRTVEWTSFQQSVPQGQTVTVFTPAR